MVVTYQHAMAYMGGDRYTSPYRSRLTPLRKDHTPSIAGSRYASPHTSIDPRSAYSPQSPYGGDQRYSSNSHFTSSGASVSTNVLDGLIDNALSRKPRPSPSNNYRSPSPASRMPPTYERDTKIHCRPTSRTYYRPSDNTSAPHIGADSGYRSATTSRESSPRYRTRDPSPRYGARYGGDAASYVSRSPSLEQRRGVVPRSDRRDDNGSRAPRDRERGFTSDRGRGSVYARNRDSNGRGDYNDRDRRNDDNDEGRRGRDWNRGDEQDYTGMIDYDNVNVNVRGGSGGDSNSHSRQPAVLYGRNDAYREGGERQMENYHTNASPLNSRHLPTHESQSRFNSVDVFQSDMSTATGALFGTSQSVAAIPTHTIPFHSAQHTENGGLYSTPQSLAGIASPNFPIHSTQSTASKMSTSSTWHGDDIIILPKGQKESGVAAAATAAASLIVNDVNSVCGFETAARSITNLMRPETEEKAAMAVLTPAIIGHSHDGQSHIPMSYSLIREGMKRDLIVAASVNTSREDKNDPLPMDAYQFWSRCTLLVATTILKAGPQYKQIALAASETVMMHGIASLHQDWLKAADLDLKQTSNAVSEIIGNYPGGSETLASMATIALLSEGNKTISMERIRRSVFVEAASQYSQADYFQQERLAVTENKSTLLPRSCDESSSRFSKNCMKSRSNVSQEMAQVYRRNTPLPPRSHAESPSNTMPPVLNSKRQVSTRPPDGSPHRVRNHSFNDQEELQDKAMVIPTLSLVPSEHVFANMDIGDNRKSAIRNIGSLLDANSKDDDDSKDDEESCDKATIGRVNIVQTLQQMGRSPSTIARREYMSAAVNKIMESSSEGTHVKREGIGSSAETRKQFKNAELERKRCEIAMRINKIQRRAAADRDMPDILGKMDALEDNLKHESDYTRGKTKELAERGGHRSKNSRKTSRQIQDNDKSTNRDHGANSSSKASPSFVDTFLQTFACAGDQSDGKSVKMDDEWEAFRLTEVLNGPVDPRNPVQSGNWETLDSLAEQEQLVEEYVSQKPSKFDHYLNGPAKPAHGTGIPRHTQSMDSNGAFAAAFNSGTSSNMPVKMLKF